MRSYTSILLLEDEGVLDRERKEDVGVVEKPKGFVRVFEGLKSVADRDCEPLMSLSSSMKTKGV